MFLFVWNNTNLKICFYIIQEPLKGEREYIALLQYFAFFLFPPPLSFYLSLADFLFFFIFLNIIFPFISILFINTLNNFKKHTVWTPVIHFLLFISWTSSIFTEVCTPPQPSHCTSAVGLGRSWQIFFFLTRMVSNWSNQSKAQDFPLMKLYSHSFHYKENGCDSKYCTCRHLPKEGSQSEDEINTQRKAKLRE